MLGKYQTFHCYGFYKTAISLEAIGLKRLRTYQRGGFAFKATASQSAELGSVPSPSNTKNFKHIHRSPVWCSAIGVMYAMKYKTIFAQLLKTVLAQKTVGLKMDINCVLFGFKVSRLVVMML